jgi:hypothetical protein
VPRTNSDLAREGRNCVWIGLSECAVDAEGLGDGGKGIVAVSQVALVEGQVVERHGEIGEEGVRIGFS